MAAIDVTGVVTEVAAQAAPVAAIGAAVMLLLVAIKAFKWVRMALDGGETEYDPDGFTSDPDDWEERFGK